MTKEQEYLTALLRSSLTLTEAGDSKEADYISIDWDWFIKLSWTHKLASYVYDRAAENMHIPENVKRFLQEKAITTVKQNFRLLFWAKKILDEFGANGIAAVLLKGMTAAVYFPNPLYRKSGDIDILIFENSELETIEAVMSGLGYHKNETQSALHHVAFANSEGIEVEVHTMLAEPFDNHRVNERLDRLKADIRDSIVTGKILGIELPVLREDYQAFELLLHMLQHYLRSGFGIRLLCDWVVFWNSNITEKYAESYSRLCDEFGVRKFSDMITSVCVRWLGLAEESCSAIVSSKSDEYFTTGEIERYWNEFWRAEEFGKSSADRMVSLRGNKKSDYIKEFHHQMHLNFPRVGKCPVLWPVLWVITLIKFLVNNKRVRGVALKDVLKSAGERGSMNEKLMLFRDI